MEPSKPAGGSKPSKVELTKLASEYLKTFVADEIANGSSHLSEDAATILKFHGSYQQDDRDVRTQHKKEGKEKAYQFMVRVRIVGGRLTADQYLACDHLARTIGNGTLRITTRQEFQLHGVLKDDLKSTIRAINESLLSTLAACGDVERNVLCCPAPLRDAVRDRLYEDAELWAAALPPRGRRATGRSGSTARRSRRCRRPADVQVPTPGDDPVEPIYGKTYLPRKFKTAFALPEDNCTDIHANDLGYLAIVEDGELVGYNVLVGGGLGTTPSAQKTFPFLAVPLCYVDRADVRKIGEAVLKVFRDFGNRSDRKRARLKYIIHDWGLPAFRAKIEEYLGHPLTDPRPVQVTEVEDHLGWHRQADGKLFLGLPVENGRIRDDGDYRLLSGLRAFFEKYRTPGRLTCQQSILLMDLEPSWRPEIERWLEEYGIATVERISTVRRWSMACPALPTCGLAVTEAERALPGVLDELEQELARQGLENERFTVRMTGCPNGCARPYNSDIGLVGPVGPHQQGRDAGAGNLHDLPGRPHDRRPAQRRVQGLRPVRPDRRRAAARLRPVQGGAPGRRDVRRLLRPAGRRRTGRSDRPASSTRSDDPRSPRAMREGLR